MDNKIFIPSDEYDTMYVSLAFPGSRDDAASVFHKIFERMDVAVAGKARTMRKLDGLDIGVHLIYADGASDGHGKAVITKDPSEIGEHAGEHFLKKTEISFDKDGCARFAAKVDSDSDKDFVVSAYMTKSQLEEAFAALADAEDAMAQDAAQTM